MKKTSDNLNREVEELRARLSESENALNAIRNGEADAIVVSGKGGDRIFSLTSAETPYRLIIEEMDEGALIVTAEGTILYHNQRFANLLEKPATQIAGSNIFSFVPEDEHAKFRQLIKKGLEGRASGVITYFNNTRYSPSYLNLSLSPLPPEITGDICIIVSDVTKMQRYQDHLKDMVNEGFMDIEKANLKLRETQQKLDNALENGNIGTWEWNLKTNEVLFDRRTERILGIEPDTIEKTFEAFKNLVHEEDINHLRNAISRSILENVPLETIFRLKSDNRFLSAKASLVLNDEGIPVQMSGVFFDVSELKKSSERVLLRLSEELLRSNKELENFAYVASHDLQEPLRMVSSFTQLLAKQYHDKLDERAYEYIHFAVDGARRMYDLLNGLLAYSRIHTKGKAFTRVDLNRVMDSVKENLRLVIEERNAKVEMEKLPLIYADESQMTILFQNLISNGIKFSTKPPKIYITTKTENNHYVFSVRDEGMGIDPQYFERIFQMFQRLMPKEQYEGTGMGLAICKRIVERHSGDIWIESEPGKGSTFYFTIPLENN